MPFQKVNILGNLQIYSEKMQRTSNTKRAAVAGLALAILPMAVPLRAQQQVSSYNITTNGPIVHPDQVNHPWATFVPVEGGDTFLAMVERRGMGGSKANKPTAEKLADVDVFKIVDSGTAVKLSDSAKMEIFRDKQLAQRVLEELYAMEHRHPPGFPRKLTRISNPNSHGGTGGGT